MSIEIAVNKAKKIEGLLKKLGFNGAGIYDLTVSAEPELDRNVVRACRKVATIRNKVVHEDGFTIAGSQLSDFIETADYAICELQEELDRREAAVRAAQSVQGRTAPDTTKRRVSADNAIDEVAQAGVGRDRGDMLEPRASSNRKFDDKQFWREAVALGLISIFGWLS